MNKKTNILIVNDDGIEAYGIAKLAAMAANFGDVWVVAPEGQCSGMSQRLTIFSELNVQEREFPATVRAAYSVSGTPADCVKVALKSLLPVWPDYVFSGINAGFNAGYDIAYSGTVGAAMEAVLHDIPAIAFSTQHDGSYEITDKYLMPIAEELMQKSNAGEIWNVNFPGGQACDFKGIIRGAEAAQSFFFENDYQKLERDGKIVFTPFAKLLGPNDAPKGTDVWAVLNGYIAIGRIKNALYI
jgi:5'-nucleotidase